MHKTYIVHMKYIVNSINTQFNIKHFIYTRIYHIILLNTILLNTSNNKQAI